MAELHAGRSNGKNRPGLKNRIIDSPRNAGRRGAEVNECQKKSKIAFVNQ
jgi:hypothetical protein